MNNLPTSQRLIDFPLPSNLEGYSNPEDVITRHDKNLANNVADFLEYGSRAKLCMNLSIYFQFVYGRTNSDFDGFYPFDIKHFCELFEWSDSSLQRVVTKKEELYITEHRNDIYRAFKVDPEDKDAQTINTINNIERFAKTKIGDAFFRLRFQEIVYSNQSQFIEDGKKVIVAGRSVSLLEEFIAGYTWLRGKASKLKIIYIPNEKNILNNVKVFAFTNCKTLGELRKNDNLDFLHLHMGFIVNSLKIQKVKKNEEFSREWNINRKLIARLLGLDPKRDIYELNKEIKRKLNKYSKLEISEPFLWRFSDSDFSVLLTFPKLEPASKEQLSKAFASTFRRHFENKLYDVYVEQHANLEEKPLSFMEWLSSPELDVEQKKFAYVTSQRVIYHNKTITIDKLTNKDLLKIGITAGVSSTGNNNDAVSEKKNETHRDDSEFIEKILSLEYLKKTFARVEDMPEETKLRFPFKDKNGLREWRKVHKSVAMIGVIYDKFGKPSYYQCYN